MTTQTTKPSPRPRRLLRSAAAILLAFIAVFVLSLGTDQLLHELDVYPPWGQPMFDTGQNLLALSYRIIYTVLGGYIAARLAPHKPMRHALILGGIGTAFATLGATAAITMADLGPSWYPIALVVTAIPCTWLGGVLHRVWHGEG
jgi:hypothetical protein